MKNIFQILILLTLTVSCTDSTAPEKSGIEVINCKDSVTAWKEMSRSSHKEVKDSTLFFMKYRFSDSLEAHASYRNNELKAIWKTLHGTSIMLMECYPNGQAKGNVKFNDKGILHGKAKYYYSDGRIKTTGYFENGNKVKEWKEFSSNGRLDLTTTYKGKKNK